LDFLWKQQARKELEEMSEMRRHTNQLLQNLLPLHVAKFFLHCDRHGSWEDIFFWPDPKIVSQHYSLIRGITVK
jgi:adenylate cyclase 8